MNVTSKIRADLTRPGVPERIYAVQNDRLTHSVEIALSADGVAWEIPTGTQVVIRYAKPDGTGGVYSTGDDGAVAWSFLGNVLTIALVEQMLTVAGLVPVEVNFIVGTEDAAQKLTTFRFVLQVAPSVVTDAEIVSSDYFSIFTAEAAQMADYAAMVRAAYGAPRVAATAEDMSDQSLIYVYTGSETGYSNGYWYYYNGSAWTRGNQYQTTGVNTDPALVTAGTAADAKAAGDGIRGAGGKIDHVTGNVAAAYTQIDNVFINPSGGVFGRSVGINLFVYTAEPNTTYTVWKATSTTLRLATGTIAAPASGDSYTFGVFPATSSGTITTGPNDSYLYIQLWTSAAAAALKTIDAHLPSLIVTKSDIVSEISVLQTDVGYTGIPLGARSAEYYTGNVGSSIIVNTGTTAATNSSGFVVDLSDYIGTPVRLDIITTDANSSRISALCTSDESHIIQEKWIEKDFNAGSWPDGAVFTPTQAAHTLYVSYLTATATARVRAMGGVVGAMAKLEQNVYRFAAYVDCDATDDSGDGTAAAPYKTLQTAVDSGAMNIYAKAGVYAPFAVLDRVQPLRIMLWHMHGEDESGWQYEPITPTPPKTDPDPADQPKIEITGTGNFGVDIRGAGEVYLSDIWVHNVKKDLFILWKIKRGTLVRCYASSNDHELDPPEPSGFSGRWSNLTFIGCKAWDIALDGFNFHYYGNYDMFDCVAYACDDDGVSHHDSCTGTIRGGEFYGCGKGGVSSPTYGSTVDVIDVYTHNNTQFGILARSNESYNVSHGRIVGCVAKNNGTKDIQLQHAVMVGWNNIYDSKSISTDSTFTEY